MLPEAFIPLSGVSDPHHAQQIETPSTQPPIHDGVGSISEYFEIIEKYAECQDWFFRGEPEKYTIPGLPKIARDYYTKDGRIDDQKASELELLIPPEESADGFPVYSSCITEQEVAIVEKFKADPPDDEMFAAMVGSAHEGPGWVSFAQHYGEKTRLLDVSRDPLVALYFACQGDKEQTGFIWLYPMPTQFDYEPADYREIFDIGIGIDAKERLDKAKRERSEHKAGLERRPLDGVFRLEIDAPNERIVAQRGAFMWSPKVLSPLTKGAFCIHINGAAKEDLRSKLFAFGIHGKGLKLDGTWP